MEPLRTVWVSSRPDQRRHCIDGRKGLCRLESDAAKLLAADMEAAIFIKTFYSSEFKDKAKQKINKDKTKQKPNKDT